MQKVAQSFNDIQLPNDLQRSISKMGYRKLTSIQAKAIPLGLLNQDLIACAQTGTGKTAAFCIPIVARLEKNAAKSALILVPTGEIALQIGKLLDLLTEFLPKIATTTIVGGVPMTPQIRELAKKPRIIIATPGRFSDHLRRGTVSLFKTGMLVLDEADRMLDLGFSVQLKEILRLLPSQRQTLMFSATLPIDIQRLAAKYLKDLKHIQ